MTEYIAQSGHEVPVVVLRAALIAWGKKHYRSFPWRETQEPYRVLIAELMLHRTQARQVVPVYEKFVERYPDVVSLAQVSKEDLRQTLYSLGLRWRIDLIHDLAADLMMRFGGRVPERKEDLLSLPGVSQYIAGAVRCFVWNKPEALVDTNIVRVVGRVFGLEVKDSSRRNRQYRELIGGLVDPVEPRAYNFSLLDLAEAVCTKRQPPACTQCPIVQWCKYGKSITGPKAY